jgi:hypothetical protein
MLGVHAYVSYPHTKVLFEVGLIHEPWVLRLIKAEFLLSTEVNAINLVAGSDDGQ